MKLLINNNQKERKKVKNSDENNFTWNSIFGHHKSKMNVTSRKRNKSLNEAKNRKKDTQ